MRVGAQTASRPARGGYRRAVPAVALLAIVAIVLVVHAAPARAVILPAVTLDGPSEDIVGFGGVAMAEDGSGGVVYLKRVDGVAHVFVSRFVGGHWLAPIRVDNEEPFAASSPRIGAAEGGELIVVWATPFATNEGHEVYEMVASVLGAGGETFGPATIVDPNIEEATGTSPDLAVSSTGQADVVYRVVKPDDKAIPLLRPGDVAEEVRVAHFNGNRWSDLGAINRDTGVSMRAPTQTNAPQIAIGPTGNGVVVWQEPNIEGVARIWARRLFGATLDYVLPVGAETYNGAPIGQDADAPSVAVSWLGQADVAYRQSAGPGSPLPGPRIFLNILPSGESTTGAEFLGPSIADSAVPGGAGASIGPPSIDIDEKEDLRILYDANGSPRVIEGDDHGLSGTISLGSPFVGEPLAASVMNPQGGGVSAWPSADAQGDPAVAVREDFPGGAVQTGLVSGGAGGAIDELAVGRSGLGDGLIAFQQGPLGNAAIVADQATAPPAELVLSAPRSWVKPGAAVVTWQSAVSAAGPLRYEIVLDGRVLATAPGATRLQVNTRGLGSGTHRVQAARDRRERTGVALEGLEAADRRPAAERDDQAHARRSRDQDPRQRLLLGRQEGGRADQLRRRSQRARPCERDASLRGRGDLRGRRPRQRQARQQRRRAAGGEHQVRTQARRARRDPETTLARRRPVTARLLLAVACALAVTTPLAAAPSPAGADVFGPISLVSAGDVGAAGVQQAEYAHDATISGDGRYVAFDGAVGGVTGVWRRDLASGAIERVAGGDAELPSISEDGRYISFTTTADLVPEDGARGPNVWVRDMEPGAGEPAYVLASAVDGSMQALSYEYANPEQEEVKFGAVAAGRSAISADGREVAFVTTAVSNLAGPQTPAMEVAVRYLASEQTVLVSGEYDPSTGQTSDTPVPAVEGLGAVYAGTQTKVGFGAPPADGAWGSNPPPGASISADGSTVAWMGANIGQQAWMLPGESVPPLYTEPLWRRIAPGSQTSTERVTGGSDPSNPACVASGEPVLPPRLSQSAADPCQGPFESETEGSGGQSIGLWAEANAGDADFVPRLSGNGEAVAFVASAQPVALGLGFGGEFGEPADLYVASMRAGLTRDQALTPLTQVGGANVAADSSITDFDDLRRRRAGRVHDAAHAVRPRFAGVRQRAGGRTGRERAVRGRPRRRHADAGERRLRRRAERTDARLGVAVPGEEDPYCQPLASAPSRRRFSADGQPARLLLDGLEPGVRRRQLPAQPRGTARTADRRQRRFPRRTEDLHPDADAAGDLARARRAAATRRGSSASRRSRALTEPSCSTRRPRGGRAAGRRAGRGRRPIREARRGERVRGAPPGRAAPGRAPHRRDAHRRDANLEHESRRGGGAGALRSARATAPSPRARRLLGDRQRDVQRRRSRRRCIGGSTSRSCARPSARRRSARRGLAGDERSAHTACSARRRC